MDETTIRQLPWWWKKYDDTMVMSWGWDLATKPCGDDGRIIIGATRLNLPNLVNVYTTYGKSTHGFHGRSTIFMAIFNSYVSLPEGMEFHQWVRRRWEDFSMKTVENSGSSPWFFHGDSATKHNRMQWDIKEEFWYHSILMVYPTIIIWYHSILIRILISGI